MKKIIFSMLTFGLALISTSVIAQDVIDQNEYLRSNDVTGKYISVHGIKKAIKDITLCKSSDYSKTFTLKLVVDTEYSDKFHYYRADSPFFAATYSNRMFYPGSGAIILGSKTILQEPSKSKIVFTGGYAFVLKKWKDKDNYELASVLQKEGAKNDDKAKKAKKVKKKGGFFSRLKSAVKQVKSGKKDVRLQKEVLQPYLDAAIPKQEAAWETPAGKALKAKEASYDVKINGGADALRYVYYVNNSGKTMYIYSDKSNKATRYAPGKKIRFMCGHTSLFYDYTGKRFYYPNDVTLFHGGANVNKCGKTFNIIK